MAILIFPIDMPESQLFARYARAAGVQVIEASSVPATNAASTQNRVFLPYITDPAFPAMFARVLREHGVGRCYSPHTGVWNCLSRLSADKAFSSAFSLCNPYQHEDNCVSYREAYAFGAWSRQVQLLADEPQQKPLSEWALAGLHRAYNGIPGQSDDLKLWLLSELFRSVVAGDVIEIGSAYGRSAYAIAWFARCYAEASVICIDPWQWHSSKAGDQGGQAALVDLVPASFDGDLVFQAFLANMAGFDHVGYIRSTSRAALPLYEKAVEEGELTADEEISVAVTGQIAVLHIDGSHKYEDFKADLERWTPFLVPGAWLLIDDYLWAFGDGPSRAGDELLDLRPGALSFTVGDTLCIRW